MTEVASEFLWLQVAQSVKNAIMANFATPVSTISMKAGKAVLRDNETNLSKPYNRKFATYFKDNLQAIQRYFVYQYHFLDDLDFMTNIDTSIENSYDKTIISEVKKRFARAGWEGDGDLQLLWFPPFIDLGPDDSHGFYVWHVKQSNNGTSWIASPYELLFKRLLDQQ